MNPNFVAYLICVPVFVAIDMVWLLGPGRPFYVSELGTLMKTSPNLPAAVAFYLLYCVGIIYFAVSGSVQNGNPSQALIHGAILGLIAYGTYDLTNLAVINGFTLKIALIDLIWGSILSGVASYLVARITMALT